MQQSIINPKTRFINKNVVRKQYQRLHSMPTESNMFAVEPLFTEQSVTSDPIQEYSIIGDRDFKKSFYQKLESTNDQQRTTSQTQPKEQLKTMKPTTLRFRRTKNLTFGDLHQLDRQKRTIKKFEQIQAKWNEKQIRVIREDNPTKHNLILEHQKTYWQMSLRNNTNRLFNHLQGIPVKNVKMHLQTQKGTKFLESQVDIVRKDYSQQEIVLRGKSGSLLPAHHKFKAQEFLKVNKRLL